MGKELKCEVVQHIGVISARDNGWQKELNRVSWNGNDPKWDIREWKPGHSMASKGITFTDNEAEKLLNLLKEANIGE